MSEHRVAARSEVAPGMTKRIVVDDIEMLLCNVGGTFYAIEDVCTHDGGALDQGQLQGPIVECPRHLATFDVRTGEALTLPAVMPVGTFPVTVRGDDIFVEV